MNKKGILFGALAILTLASCGPTEPEVSYTLPNPYTGPVASGVYNWTTKPEGMSQTDWVNQQSELLYEMESYAMRHHLAGIPLYDDSSLELFSPRVKLVSETYVPDYGFGINESSLDENGNMHNGQQFAPTGANEKGYFQSYATEDSGTFNYWNSQGQDVSGKHGMIASTYFTIVMKEDKSGYEWINGLSKDLRPIPLVDGEEVEYHEGETYTSWRVHLFTAEDEGTEQAAGRKFRYNISPKSKYYEKYHNRPIQLEDYLTPYQAILDNALVRASGLVTDSSGFLGANDYLYTTDEDLKDWSNVGIQLNEEEGAMDFTFVTPKTQFYAMYNLSSSLYTPLPREYLMELGGDNPDDEEDDATSWAAGCRNFGLVGSGTNYEATVDNLLSTGPYIVTYWQTKKQTIYQKNDLYYDTANIHFAGYAETIYDNEEAAYRDFLNGKLDNVTCPSDYINTHNGQSYAHSAEGSTILKINLNSCTAAEWNHYFGPNGTMYQHAANQAWDIKYLMSDDDFLDGLFFSINRAQLANEMGRNPSVGYLSDAYKIDPEHNLAYRDTEAGRRALSPYTSIDPNGYSTAMATTLFQSAVQRGIGTGAMARNTPVSLTFIWRYDTSMNKIGGLIKTMIESVFNAAAKEWGVTLTINNRVAGASYTDAYTLMDRGEFDLAEGAITGNVLNPLEFMSVICTNSLSQGFTCNWGEDTAAVSSVQPITWDADGDGVEEAFSFDAFYTACNGAAIVENGVNLAPAAQPSDPNNRAFVDGGNTVFVFDTPSTIVDPDTGHSLIEYSYGFLWFMIARGTTTSGWYNDLSSTYIQNVTYNQNQSCIEFSIPTATLQSLYEGLLEASGGDASFNQISITLQVTAEFPSYGITRTTVVTNYVPIETCGVHA